MSNIRTAIASSHRISLTAMEEASRFGLRTADVDHMLLALTLDSGPAGEALRGLGVTLTSARAATAAQHTEQLSSLGITPTHYTAGPITFHETGGYVWSDNALVILKQASAGKRSGDSGAILRALMSEPSGLIEATLTRAGTSSAAVIGRLSEEVSLVDHPPEDSNIRSNTLVKSAAGFLSASPEEVWSMVSDPARIPEWDASISSVASENLPHASDGIRLALARTERADGKRTRIRPEFMRVRIEQLVYERPILVEWRFSYPDSERANARCIRLHLKESAGGTQLRLALAWERGVSSSSLRGLLLRPLHLLITGLQASQLAAVISRAFR